MRKLILIALLMPRAAPAESPSTATMPLSEAIGLFAAKDAAKPEPPPPIGAIVQQVSMVGRVGADGLEITAKVRVDVLASSTWVKVPILDVGESTKLVALPELKDGSLAISGGALCLVTNAEGSYVFEVELFERARREGDRRSVRVGVGAATLANLKLRLDPTAFTLDVAGLHGDGEELTAYPTDGVIALSWRHSAKATIAAARPPVPSLVTGAFGAAVSTLEGKLITRTRYELQLQGAQSVEVELPAGVTLQEVLVNGASAPPTRRDRAHVIGVSPRRAGETKGELEIITVEELGSYKLAGSLAIEGPKLSWPIHEIYFELFLPEVFAYQWRGGSLAPVEAKATAPFAHAMPTPGRKLAFHQHLIARSAPHMKIDYSADLEGRYFR